MPATKPIRKTTTTTARAKASSSTTKATNAKSNAELAISSEPARPAAQPTSTGEDKVAAMRAVNAASQRLSVLVQGRCKVDSVTGSGAAKKPASGSGSGLGSGKGNGNGQKEADSAAREAAKSLRELRVLCPGDLDVERAASCVVGKLIGLEMFVDALSALSEMRVSLIGSYPHPDVPVTTQPYDILSLPLPAPSEHSLPLSETLEVLVSNYLVHALVVLTSPSSLPHVNCQSYARVHELSRVLARAEMPTLLRWIPQLPFLPLKQRDAMCKRAYSILIRFSATSSARPSPHTSKVKDGSRKRDDYEHARAVYVLRTYALRCLLYSTPATAPPDTTNATEMTGVVEPDVFWDQVGKFCTAFVKACGCEEEEVIRVVLEAFGELVDTATETVGREEGVQERWMKGRGWVGFCECWMGFAKRVGDIEALDRISGVMTRPASPARTQAASQPLPPTRNVQGQNQDDPTLTEPQLPMTKNEQDAYLLKGARICAVFVQVAAVFERFIGGEGEDGLRGRVAEAISNLKICSAYISPSDSEGDGDGDEDLRRARGRVERALERTRRTAVKLLDGAPKGTGNENRNGKEVARNERVDSVKELLEGIVGVYEHSIENNRKKSQQNLTADITPALDTLFVLARVSLVTKEYDTYSIAYDYLSRATGILGFSSTKESFPASSIPAPIPEVANYIRCISGAYHNLAGILYQDGRHAAAVRFLKEGCKLGGMAIEMRLGGIDGGEGEEGWKSLSDQLYRRWELLGICHLKIGDRGPAYDAFVESIKSYPFADVGFARLARTNGLGGGGMFKSPTSLKQLGVIIDRVTYIGTCELFFQPPDVSLKNRLQACALNITVVGAILERQIESLEGSLWKEGARDAVRALLADALGIYVGKDWPVRRGRVLVRCLEFGYKDGVGGRHSDDVGEEALELLGRDALSDDVGLASFCPQYRATTHLWLGLHAHKREDVQQTSLVAYHCEEACKILTSLFASPATEPTTKVKKSSPAKKSPMTAKGKGRVVTKGVVGRRGAVAKSSRNMDPVTPIPRKVLEAVSLNTSQATPSRPVAGVKKSALVFDNFDKLLTLLQMVSHLLGLLGLVLVKVKLLDVTRQLCGRHVGTAHDGYITASVDLAHEYVKLGKTGKAGTIYGQALSAVRNGGPSDAVRTIFFLRYSESLAIVNNVLRSSSTYCEALGLSSTLSGEEKGMSTAQRVTARVGSLERAAIAAHTYSVIQYARDDLTGSLGGMLQSLRLWNRAADTLARLIPPPSTKSPVETDENPFQLAPPKEASLTSESALSQAEVSPQRKVYPRRSAMDGLEWRITNGLLNTLFALCHAYFERGSPREADYFAQQAQHLAESLNAPTMVSRALTRKAEIQLHQGRLEDGYGSLMRAAELLEDMPGTDAADIRRLRGYYSQLKAMHIDAHELYRDATQMLEELEKLFAKLDGLPTDLRKSSGMSPKSAPTREMILPVLLASVLRQHIWLLRDDAGDDCRCLLERFMDLSQSGETKSEENALMAKLTLHDVYGRFRADMFLSSLVESTIALPMGMSGDKLFSLSPSTQEILIALDNAENLFWADLALVARRGHVSRVRDATVSLAIIKALQSSLGKAGGTSPALSTCLLDCSTAITLRRELLEAIQQKFQDSQALDDLQWPLMSPNGSPLSSQTRLPARMTLMDSDEEGGPDLGKTSLKQYWESILEKCNNRSFNLVGLSDHRADNLPKHWTVVNINITEDKSTMFVTRQRALHEPLIFCVPLKGRRETEEDEHLTFDDALNELKQIITLSNQGARQAIHVKNNDPQARASWWAERIALDKRMQELLDNIEFCWLGAFKTILSQPTMTTPEIITDLRTRLDKVFQRSLQSQERKQKTKICLDDNLLECFSTLSPKCRDEEIEDLVYFILDLYQLHGVPVAISEVDVDQLVIDLRTALEEHAAKAKGKVTLVEDSHIFLVLDKNVQGIPWESIPILRGRSVSRIPSMDFLLDRLDLAKWQKGTGHREQDGKVVDRAVVDPKKTFYVLNPSGDLKGTEGRFSWLTEMDGWEGTIGHPPSEQQFLDALARKDLLVYFGHGGGEQYIRSHKIRNLPRCAATMLWGCSSGALRDMGDFDRVGTPYNYMLAGCPTLVANIWDVTDRDIDKFSQVVFNKMRLTATGLRQRSQAVEGVSLVAAVAQSRSCCKLKYLTGAAPVVYGIPFYL